MNTNRYTLAGWLAVSQAVIYPLAIAIGFFSGLSQSFCLGLNVSSFGPSQVLYMIFTGISVYTLYMFKKLLNERYSFHGIDIFIIIIIVWNVLMFISSSMASSLHVLIWPLPEIGLSILSFGLIAYAMVFAGVINIIIAVKLLKQKESLNDLISAFAYITLVAGILELTILLSPIALILQVILYVVLGMVFLREKELVEFV
ncbi:MAG: hypothetical protein GY839_04905 [candidate division Zixibacteria bacterium]|nr:hypothetical protein [candidate division Zixibacteria bacterium]